MIENITYIRNIKNIYNLKKELFGKFLEQKNNFQKYNFIQIQNKKFK